MVSVDQALCSGCGICIEACPEVFAWTSDGKAAATASKCESHDLENIADSCPMECIDV